MTITGTSGKRYEIEYDVAAKRHTCTCPDFQFRHRTAGACKHVRALEAGKPLAVVEDEAGIPLSRFSPERRRDIEAMFAAPADARYKPRADFAPVVARLKAIFADCRFEVVGSWRRGKAQIKDLDIILDRCPIERLLPIAQIEMSGTSRVQARIDGVQCDLRVVTKATEWVSMLMHCTGSKDENIRLRKIAASKHMRLNEYGLWRGERRVTGLKTEADYYRALEETYRAPEAR